jgi:putative ABC transport system substrate-binding protein
MFDRKRREFIGLLGGAAAWPLTARAQPGEKMRHIGVLIPVAEADLVGQARLGAFLQGLQQLGWADGRNIRIDTRWGASDLDLIRKYARELVALGPDVILANGTEATAALRQVTPTVPIVFAPIIDPVGAGHVESLARPGGNVTGFAGHEFALSGKSLELLKEIAPRVARVAVTRDSAGAGPAEFAAIQAVAPSLGVELRPFDVRNAGEIERAIAAVSGSSDGGLIVTGTARAVLHRKLIIALAARHRLPAVYYSRDYVADGGLISYGADLTEVCRRAATYVDRILKGAKPADLPVQMPTKYELVINLKAAKALGLDVPPTLLARADEVVE